MNYGKAIKKLRIELEENQDEFSHNIGITQGHLSSIEHEKKNPSAQLLERISEYTKIPTPVLSWLAVEEKDIPENKKEAFEILKPSINDFVSEFFN